MDKEARAAYVVAQGACAQIEAMAMQAQNTEDIAAGRQLKFKHHDFLALIDKYGIGHNAIITFLRD